MESKTLSLTGKIIVGVIAIIAIVFYVLILRNSDTDSSSIDNMITFTKFVLIITALFAVLVWIKDIVTHPKKLIQSLIFAVIFIIVILIAKYALASNEAVVYSNKLSIDAGTSNWIDTGLYTFYILGAIAILLMFLSPVFSMFAPNATANAVGEIEEEIEEMIDDNE